MIFTVLVVYYSEHTAGTADIYTSQKELGFRSLGRYLMQILATR